MNHSGLQVKREEGATMAPRLCNDLTVTVAGQGGDGSLTIISLLANAIAERGLFLFRQSNIASRIKGGHAAAMLRLSNIQRGCLGDRVGVLVAFDAEAIEKIAHRLADDAIVIYDISREPIPAGILPSTVRVIGLPFSRVSVRDLRRDMFKNCLGFAVLARTLGISDKEAKAALAHRFRRLTPTDLDHNIHALEIGFDFSDEMGLTAGHGILELPRLEKQDRIFITGNDATAFGFLAAGGRFFAGYPITPATDIMDWLNKRGGEFGVITLQAEDELAAVNMSIGASLAGVRAMTASSGPGIALMQEGICHAGSAEIPLVVVDCQRAGPSTGMPTKPEQSDIGMMTTGGNGDFPRVVLCPGTVDECFESAVLATNLAQVAQCPIYISLDGISQTAFIAGPFNLDAVEIDEGKRLDAADVAGLEAYCRYSITEDGISPLAVPGTPGAVNLVTGNERNEWGLVSTEPKNRKRMMDKRARKIETIRHRLPQAVEWGDREAEIGVVGVGMVGAVLEEASEQLETLGLKVHCHRPRTLWPILEDTMAFMNRHQAIYVIELNDSGQLARLLKGAGAPAKAVRHILKYDGVPFSAGEIVEALLSAERLE